MLGELRPNNVNDVHALQPSTVLIRTNECGHALNNCTQSQIAMENSKRAVGVGIHQWNCLYCCLFLWWNEETLVYLIWNGPSKVRMRSQQVGSSATDQCNSSRRGPESSRCHNDSGSCRWCSGTVRCCTGCWSSCTRLYLRRRQRDTQTGRVTQADHHRERKTDSQADRQV